MVEDVGGELSGRVACGKSYTAEVGVWDGFPRRCWESLLQKSAEGGDDRDAATC